MDLVPPKKKWLERLACLEASAAAFGPRPPRGPGGGIVMAALFGIIAFKATEKADHSLRVKASF
jgi:hypothetical protein